MATHFVTREDSGDGVHGRRIVRDDLAEAIEGLRRSAASDSDQVSTPLAFVCGPPPLVRHARQELLALGLPETHLRYEKWATGGH